MRRAISGAVVAALLLAGFLAGCSGGASGENGDTTAAGTPPSTASSSQQRGWPTVEVLEELDLDEPVAPDVPLDGEPDVAYARAYADYLAEELTYALRTSIADPELRNGSCQVCDQFVTLADQLREERLLVRTEPVRAEFVGISDEQVRHIVETATTVWIDVDLVFPAMQQVDEEGVVQVEVPPSRLATRLEVAIVTPHPRVWWTITGETVQAPPGQA